MSQIEIKHIGKFNRKECMLFEIRTLANFLKLFLFDDM